MTQEQTSAVSQQFIDIGKQPLEAMMDIQKGFLDAFQEVNRQWVSSVNVQTVLASELFTKLAAAKSIPDVAVACQGCASRQMEILAENGRQLMAAGEKVVPRFFGNGFSGARM